MTKKLQPYFFMLIFFVAIFIVFRFSGTFVDGSIGPDNKYLSHRIENNVLLINTSSGTYSINFINPSIAEVNFFNSENPKIDSSHAVILETDHSPVSLIKNKGHLVFSASKDFEVVVNKSPFDLIFVFHGDTLLKEWRGFFDHDTLGGFRFEIEKDEKIYGAGFRTTPANRRNQRFELYNQAHYGYSLNAPNLNFSVPFVISSKGYGLLFDNVQKGFLDIDSTRKNTLEFSSIGGRMAYYVIAGTAYDSVLHQYHHLTGFQPMPPRWAFGNLQSRFGYQSQVEAEEVVDNMIKYAYPIDALIIDLFWFGKGDHGVFFMGDLDWYDSTWPRPKQMIKDFSVKGVKTILITEPFILPESRYFDTLCKAGMLGKNSHDSTYILDEFWFGAGGLFDIFNPDMQKWFWGKYKTQIDNGVAGWWGDLGEPENHPPGLIHQIGSAEEVHNIYGHYWHKMLWDKYTKAYPDVRLFNLNRSGFAGSQRFGIFPWSGDVSRSWEGLQAQPTAVLGMALSGFPYMHSDLGGFAMGGKDEELYVRWLQYGVFNSVFRIHGDPNAPVEPYLYSDTVQDILRKYINLRYRLLPYNYTLAWMNSTTGSPLTRPLFFDGPLTDQISEIDDTYLWGPNILVAPILEKGQTERTIYLPDGKWFGFFTDQEYQGGRWIEKSVTIEEIPVFARGGSFIPMIPPIQNTDEYSSENLIIHFWNDAGVDQSEFTMYDDDGKTRDAFQKDLFELLHFDAKNFGDLLMFSFHREKNSYTGMPGERKIQLIVHNCKRKPESVLIDDMLLQPSKYQFDSNKKQLTLNFYWGADKIDIQIRK
jgi:alpha-glucosidase (family GH31 glycosyl hydrolase)